MENSKSSNNEINSELFNHINLIFNLTDEMCDYIYKGEGIRIFERLTEFINGLDVILSKSNHISEYININNVDKILINIEKAISIKDYVLLADILLYELNPLLQNWIKFLKNK